MKYDYSEVDTISPEDFAQVTSTFDSARFTRSDDIDTRRIELLLDLRQGALKSSDLFLESYTCDGCNKKLTFYDFVYTSLRDGSHPKSFVVHTLLGSKFVRNEHRPVRCSNCQNVSSRPLNYMGNNYVCCNHGNI